MLRLSITCGDINGIGPEITIKAINKIYKPGRRQIIYFCPANIFEDTLTIAKPNFEYRISKSLNRISNPSEVVTIIDIGKAEQSPGKPSARAGKTAYNSIIKAFESVKNNFSDAIVTAPTSKTSLRLAGIKYPGQTEIVADLCKSKNYMMVFLSHKMICGLLTIHEPIKNVPMLITKSNLRKSIKILHGVLQNDLKIKTPKIAVLGLNPHAGEEGKIGSEEIKIIKPALSSFKNNINVFGPFVPDAFFATKQFSDFDAVLGMYHDQMLIPFKMLNFNNGVNYTAGLPVVRTSPDHGTAYGIVGKGIADASSMIAAIRWAETIVNNRKQ